MGPNFTRTAFSIDEFAKSAGVGRDKIYEEIRTGRIRARKAGRRTLITADDARRYLDSLPELQLGSES